MNLPVSVRNKIRHVAGVSPWFLPDVQVIQGVQPPVYLESRHLVQVGVGWICDQPELVAFILSEELQR